MAYVQKKTTTSLLSTFQKMLFFFIAIIIVIVLGSHYKTKLAHYLGFKTSKTNDESSFSDKSVSARNHQILTKHCDKVAGIDISENQGKIIWDKLENVEEGIPISFIFIRATAGNNKVDRKFKQFWEAAKSKHFTCGAYHYYRPNENSVEQANLFIKTVRLKEGDFPPVLDIEKLPRHQPMDSLKVGLKRWLNKVESHYGVRPIIYSGDKYYTDFLEKEFKGYTFWIAHYDFFEDEIDEDWKFWQFTEKAKVKGIKGNVDLNIFNGDESDLEHLTIGN